MDKANTSQRDDIIQALQYHDVPESNEDTDPYERLKWLDNAFNYKPNADAKIIELSYGCSYSNMDEYVDDLIFNVYNKINDRSIYTQIATGEELAWTSHEELADKLLELEAFASSLRVVTTDQLHKREKKTDLVLNQRLDDGCSEWDYIVDTMTELSHEIMSVRM